MIAASKGAGGGKSLVFGDGECHEVRPRIKPSSQASNTVNKVWRMRNERKTMIDSGDDLLFMLVKSSAMYLQEVLRVCHGCEAQHSQSLFHFYFFAPHKEHVPRHISYMHNDVLALHASIAIMPKLMTCSAQANDV